MSGNRKFVRHALLGGVLLCALNVQAGETPSAASKGSATEHCLKVLGMQNVQVFKEMAREMSPEVVLDRIFSSVAPDFQKALLSKPTDPAKPVDRPEAMRDPKLFLPAIATMPLPNSWVGLTADGRVIEPASARAAAPDSGWERMAAEAQKKAAPTLPFFLNPAQRY
jgi:hypothetical protein